MPCLGCSGNDSRLCTCRCFRKSGPSSAEKASQQASGSRVGTTITSSAATGRENPSSSQLTQTGYADTQITAPSIAEMSSQSTKKAQPSFETTAKAGASGAASAPTEHRPRLVPAGLATQIDIITSDRERSKSSEKQRRPDTTTSRAGLQTEARPKIVTPHLAKPESATAGEGSTSKGRSQQLSEGASRTLDIRQAATAAKKTQQSRATDSSRKQTDRGQLIPISPFVTHSSQSRVSDLPGKQRDSSSSIPISPFAIHRSQSHAGGSNQPQNVRPRPLPSPLATAEEARQGASRSKIRVSPIPTAGPQSSSSSSARSQKFRPSAPAEPRLQSRLTGKSRGSIEHTTSLPERDVGQIGLSPFLAPHRSAPIPALPPGRGRKAGLAPRSLLTERLASEASAGSSRTVLSLGTSSSSGNRKLRLGIEAEFLLAAKSTKHHAFTLSEFVRLLAEGHNAYVGSGYPQMHPSLRDYTHQDAYSGWSMVIDESCNTSKSPWGLEMRTPILHADPGSSWRDDVAKTWEYLRQFYEVKDDANCSTHVHVSLDPDYSLRDLKRIACSIIHFETAFEALVPSDRRGNQYCKSNWLDGPELAREGLSRLESIDAIHLASHIFQVEHLIQRAGDKSFAWNFDSLYKLGTIEFRKPPASVTVEQALGWAELTMNFIQVSVEHGTPEILKTFPPTIKGLRRYLAQIDVPGVNERHRMDWIWKGKNQNRFRCPIPRPWERGRPVDAQLLSLAEADGRRIQERILSDDAQNK